MSDARSLYEGISRSRPPVRIALLGMVEAVEAAGGCLVDQAGTVIGTVGDPSWYDLGRAYLVACDALDREPIRVMDYPEDDVLGDLDCDTIEDWGEPASTG